MAERRSSYGQILFGPKLTRVVTGGGCLALVFTSLVAAAPADPAHGEKLARQWCASCHVVASDQKGTVAEAPPFATIARKPDFDPRKLALFLIDPHPKMPDMNLSRAEAADLAAYIGTLK